MNPSEQIRRDLESVDGVPLIKTAIVYDTLGKHVTTVLWHCFGVQHVSHWICDDIEYFEKHLFEWLPQNKQRNKQHFRGYLHKKDTAPPRTLKLEGSTLVVGERSDTKKAAYQIMDILVLCRDSSQEPPFTSIVYAQPKPKPQKPKVPPRTPQRPVANVYAMELDEEFSESDSDSDTMTNDDYRESSLSSLEDDDAWTIDGYNEDVVKEEGVREYTIQRGLRRVEDDEDAVKDKCVMEYTVRRGLRRVMDDDDD